MAQKFKTWDSKAALKRELNTIMIHRLAFTDKGDLYLWSYQLPDTFRNYGYGYEIVVRKNLPIKKMYTKYNWTIIEFTKPVRAYVDTGNKIVELY